MNTPKHVDLKEKSRARTIGTIYYTFEINVTDLPLDRDFEEEWVSGPTRFKLERDDEDDYYNFSCYPAGQATQATIKTKTGRVGASGENHSKNMRIRRSSETVTASVRINLLKSPFKFNYNSISDESSFFAIGGALELASCGGYKISLGQIGSQAKGILRDVPRALGRISLDDVIERFQRNEPTVEFDYPDDYQQQEPPRPPHVTEEDNLCSECSGRYHKRDLEIETFDEGKFQGKVYVCPDCGGEVGKEGTYEGPIPVETRYGTELH